MNLLKFYEELYALLYDSTPLAFDCGRLCERACCRVSPDLPGMFLFPGEEEVLKAVEGYAIQSAEMPGYGKVLLLSCRGRCDRQFRPLSCRVFPLAPLVDGGAVKARLDPRGRPVCPLCHQSRSGLSSAFVKNAEAAFTALLSNPETEPFLRALSAAIDNFEQPLL